MFSFTSNLLSRLFQSVLFSQETNVSAHCFYIGQMQEKGKKKNLLDDKKENRFSFNRETIYLGISMFN